MRKRGFYCPPVSPPRPSVCMSITLVHCIQKAEDIVKLFSRPDSPIILFFPTPAPIPNSKGNPYSGGSKYTGVGKIGDFRRKSPFIPETVRDMPMVIWNVNRKSWEPDRMVSFFDDLE